MVGKPYARETLQVAASSSGVGSLNSIWKSRRRVLTAIPHRKRAEPQLNVRPANARCDDVRVAHRNKRRV